ncbi:hypothetical protein ACOSQ2_029227 [Xanthoceras sorbifolium]|uniref:Uncharacterized protein n=1 Tax=Xanthoceras sorbifolium TaxID=99658 RepID=A0ABQ8HC71_9ROSI|nr:hypothetical protein JRO89_XS12G0107400 [Xanthoceras sorbifolium]
MPQVDLETLVSVCAGGSSDRKINCETLADDGADNPAQEPDPPEIPPDFPPESFWLSKDAELDWFDRNAFYERKESQKGNSNSTNLNPNPSTTSQRFSTSLKSKASIIGLPKPQKTIVDTKKKRNCKPENTRLFPKRSGSAGKSGSTVHEPSSPKVSCMGRVRSKRDRRRFKKRQHSGIELETVNTKTERSGKTGFFASFRAIFRSGLKRNTGSETRVLDRESSPRKSVTVNTHDIRDRLPRGDIDAPRTESSPPRKSVTREARKSLDGEPAEPVGLGAMRRFTSGRRSDAWADDVV